ncbi:PstS family phosphate ABC transporter substrate-binding protein [Pelomonas sp. KK5]|uniref:PstS family phosphate ABC transporter substrate-binding protein n=1 Tax=Pelomonas sp. KK5 TaxID=1855730 RepID=UPI00117EE611|nr:substrate-binding domain-containing protein [Pelomonas sp. KK5]
MRTALSVFLLALSAMAVRAADLPASDPASIEARTVAALPAYRPEQSVSGVIRIQGHGHVTLKWMERLLNLWEQGFRKFHPGVRIEQRMKGTSSAIPSLFNGTGDIAILGEEIDPAAAEAFRQVKGYLPQGIAIATGAYDVRNFDYAQQFFVHRDNPLDRLTLAQLDAIYGMEHRRGEPHNIRNWGQLGLAGDWAAKPINPYGWRIDDSFGFYLQNALLLGSHRWNNALRDYVHIYNPGGTIYDHGQQILDALRADRHGIAVSNIRYANADVKPLALAATAGGPFVQASKATLIDRSYPLTRLIPAVIDHPPGRPVEARVREFIRFLLSREGQQAINEDGRYLPVSAATAAAELRQLDQAPPGEPLAASSATGAIRICGDEHMAAIAARWAEGFRTLRPDASVEFKLTGTASAMPCIYGTTGDIALLGRESDITDDNGFFKSVGGYPPLRLELMNGSLDVPGQSAAQAVFVHADNPLRQLTVAQLEGLFGVEDRRGPGNIRTWGELGLGGEWQDKPVHLYGHDIDSEDGLWFVRQVLQESRKLNWEQLAEFDDGGAKSMAALRGDRYGLAVSNLKYANPGTRVLAIAAHEKAPFVAPSARSVIARDYPLARRTFAFVNRKPGMPLDPTLAAFLAYVLSPQGQGELLRLHGYLPLSEPLRVQQLDLLK